MIQIARVEDGNILEIREIDKMSSIGKHKRYLWTRIYDKVPTYDKFYQQLEGPLRNINEKSITLTYDVVDLPKEHFDILLRAEEYKRIRYLISQDQLIELILLMHSGDEIDDHFLGTLDKIKLIRTKSYELSIMDKLPKDYEDDKYWN